MKTNLEKNYNEKFHPHARQQTKNINLSTHSEYQNPLNKTSELSYKWIGNKVHKQ